MSFIFKQETSEGEENYFVLNSNDISSEEMKAMFLKYIGKLEMDLKQGLYTPLQMKEMLSDIKNRKMQEMSRTLMERSETENKDMKGKIVANPVIGIFSDYEISPSVLPNNFICKDKIWKKIC